MKIRLNDISCYLSELGIEHRTVGNLEKEIDGFSSIDNYRVGTLTWVKSKERIQKAELLSLDGIIAIVQEGQDVNVKYGIYTNESKRAFFTVIEHFFTDNVSKPSIGQGVYLSQEVKLGENVIIGANSVLDGDIYIGNGTVIEPCTVILNKVTIGKNCYIQAGVCIGIAGYGYTEDEYHKKTMIKHYGGVRIGNRVFIGSHTNIARGTIDDTVIEDGVKIAPSTHIGHNNHIKENASIVCSILHGSVKTGNNAYVAASVVRNQITIGDNSIIGMGSIVHKDVPDEMVVLGNPAKPIARNTDGKPFKL